MTKDQRILSEAYPIIEKIAKSRSSNGAFAYYCNDDIRQEVWCMCLEAMGRYNPEVGPIENYLSRHVANRLKNLKRDKYFRPGSDVPSSGFARTRMNLVNALPLGGGDIADQGILLCGTPISVDPVNYVLCEETLVYIKERLPEDLLLPFEALIGNNKVRSQVTDLVRKHVAEILKEREEDVGNEK